MFKDLYSKIDKLHEITSKGIFLQARYSLAEKDLEKSYIEFKENIGIIMADFINDFSGLLKD